MPEVHEESDRHLSEHRWASVLAKADILLIDFDHLGAGFYADPVNALVDAGCERDVDMVIVDGKIWVIPPGACGLSLVNENVVGTAT
ncbi:MAG TPA: hypothetical protein VFJ45_05910 [bacterium]|nr:hypothetical protein [bacterium]